MGYGLAMYFVRWKGVFGGLRLIRRNEVLFRVGLTLQPLIRRVEEAVDAVAGDGGAHRADERVMERVEAPGGGVMDGYWFRRDAAIHGELVGRATEGDGRSQRIDREFGASRLSDVTRHFRDRPAPWDRHGDGIRHEGGLLADNLVFGVVRYRSIRDRLHARVFGPRARVPAWLSVWRALVNLEGRNHVEAVVTLFEHRRPETGVRDLVRRRHSVRSR